MNARALPGLVPDYEAFLRFAGREPRTLAELAVARETVRHERRLAEIKAMAKKLQLLEAFLPALAERGIKLSTRTFNSWDQGKTVRIESRASTSADNQLHEALIALGFKETERKHLYRDEHTVTLQHGRWLVVSFVITVPMAEKPAGTAS